MAQQQGEEWVEAPHGAAPGLEALTPAERAEMAEAMKVLTNGGGLVPRLAEATAGLTARIGAQGLKLVPGLERLMFGVAEAALARAFDVAVIGMAERRQPRTRARAHLGMALVGASGALGGAAGLAGFVPDAFVTTLAIMRNVARIAQEEGEDLSLPESRSACLTVFASSFASSSKIEGDSAEGLDVSYFLTRSALQGRAVLGLLSEVARRYGLALSQKLALQAIPAVGAVSGATLNMAYMSHYQSLARAIFVLRRLRRCTNLVPFPFPRNETP